MRTIIITGALLVEVVLLELVMVEEVGGMGMVVNACGVGDSR